MKTIHIIFLLFSSFTFAQTNIIALQSRSEKPSLSSYEKDNYGAIEIETVSNVEYIGNGCIVEIHNAFHLQPININDSLQSDYTPQRDTICNLDYLIRNHFSEQAVRSMYNRRVELSGFDKLEDKYRKKLEHTEHQNSFSLWSLFLILGLFIVTFRRTIFHA